jgi:serine protease
MHRSSPAPHLHPARARPPLLCLLLLAAGPFLLADCGGGGGGGTPAPAPVILDGLAGTVLLPDYDLGRIVEQEPNDARDRPFRLPPVWPRSVLEVTGTLGVTALRFGRADPVDVLLFRCTADQEVSLELTFEAQDPTDPGHANDVRAEVFRRVTGASVAVTAAGGQPRTLVFDALGGEDYEVVIDTDGHGWWTARFTTADPVVPFAVVQSKPSAPAAPALVAAAPVRPLGAQCRCSPTHVLVRLRDACGPDGVCSRHDLRAGRTTALGSRRMTFDTPAGQDPEACAQALCASLAADPDVLWAEPDWVVRTAGVPTDPEFGRSWNLRAVGVPSAWDVTTGAPGVVVAVVDDGVVSVPDLEGRVVGGYDFVSDPGVAGDGDGRDPDPTDPGDHFLSSGLSSWHGTHVAAIIAAKHDGKGMAGIAPGCRIMPLRALGIGGGYVSDAADAILYAAALYTTQDGHRLTAPVAVVNLSIGLDQDSNELRDACNRANGQGCLLVAAVGNTGKSVQYPAAYASTLAVAAVDGLLTTTQYSSYGDEVDLAAPGGGTSGDAQCDGWHDGVLSAVLDETADPAVPAFALYVGTSQAAPHVAGAAALLKSLDPTLSPTALKTILRGTALDRGPAGEDVAYGAGLLQVQEAVKYVRKQLGNPRGDAPYLLLPTQSVQFDGLRTSITLPLYNGGGGEMTLTSATAVTDDGQPWLSATLVDSVLPAPPVNFDKVDLGVDRSVLPPTGDRYSGSILFENADGVQGTIRVVLYVKQRLRAGQILPAAVIEDGTGIARRKAYALPEFGYRYWFRGMPAGAYRIEAGEDLDGDGFFCEVGDACGWHGGATEADAVPVAFVPGQPAVQGLGVVLQPQP